MISLPLLWLLLPLPLVKNYSSEMPGALLAIDWVGEVDRQNAQEEKGLVVLFPSVDLQVFLTVFLQVFPSVFLQVFPSVFLQVFPSVFLRVFPSMFL